MKMTIQILLVKKEKQMFIVEKGKNIIITN